MAMGVSLVCVVLAASVAAETSTPADAAFLRRLFAIEPQALGSPAATKLIDEHLAGRGLDANSLAAILADEAAYEPIDAGWHRGRVRVADGASSYDVPFVFHVPRSYRPDRPGALLLAAHGQGHSGEGMARTMMRLLGSQAERYVIVAPTMPGPRHYSGKAYQEQAYLRPLRWVRRRLNIDDDRIYVSGYSQGGHCTWHLAALFPRHFAAAVAMAGVPWFEGAPHTANLYLENLSNVKFWSIWGERDRPAAPAIGQVHFNRAATQRLKELGNANYRGTELRGVGHGGCWPPRGAMGEFLAAGKRKAVPEKFTHAFHLAAHARGYYLEAVQLAARPLDMSKPIRITFTRRTSDAQGDRAAERYFARRLFKMSAELDRPNNALTIRTTRVRTVRVYVTAGLFDLSRPVTIRRNARTWRSRVWASPRCMLAHYAVDRDAAAVVYNEIDVPTTAGVRVRYKP